MIQITNIRQLDISGNPAAKVQKLLAEANWKQHYKHEKIEYKTEADIDFEQFKILFKDCAEELINKDFYIDKDNSHFIELVWRRFNKLEGEFTNGKGILLLGKIGTGKTLLLKTWLNLLFRYRNRQDKPTIEHSIKLAEGVISDYNKEEKNSMFPGKFNYENKIELFIDDLGKEPEIIKSYGQDFTPITNLLLLRYDKGLRTYATSNYNLETLTKKYGEHTIDRFKEMFNLLVIPGASRRK